MELVDRYLQAVRFWLPKDQKKDIIAELSEDLHAQIEEQESTLGRPLTKDEVEDLLRRRGAPILVASKYLPQQSLIGPVFFPIYRFVIKVVLLVYMIPWLVTLVLGLAARVFDPSGSGSHAWTMMLSKFSNGAWTGGFTALGIVTLVFAVLERIPPSSNPLLNFQPRKLPPVRNPNHIPRTSSLFEIAAQIVFVVWMIFNLNTTLLVDQPGFRIQLAVLVDQPGFRILLSPTWRSFYWAFIVLALLQAALSAANLKYPYWTYLRATLRLLSDAAGAAIFCWLLKANMFAEFLLTDTNNHKSAQLATAVNLWLSRSVPYAIVICLAIIAYDVYRILRHSANSEHLRTQQTSISGTMSKG